MDMLAACLLATRSVRQQGRWELGRAVPMTWRPLHHLLLGLQTSSSALRPGYYELKKLLNDLINSLMGTLEEKNPVL
jgi:hypothetical protein